MEQIRQDLSLGAIFLLLSLVFFTFDRLGMVSSFRQVVGTPFEFIQLPVIEIRTFLLSKLEFIQYLGEIEKENVTLSQKLVEVTAENARLQNLAAENEALRTQLGFSLPQIKTIPAKVIGSSRFLVILPEETAGIKVGATVVYGNNFVGQVVEVGKKLIKVRLPQDPSSSIPAIVATAGGPVRGTLTGKYNKLQVLEKVEKQEILPLGSIVQTAGEETVLPGLVLGKVERVEKADPSPFLVVEVESLVDFLKLTTVFVISDKES